MPLPEALQQQLGNYPPFVGYHLESHADDLTAEILKEAQQWKESITSPDSVCQTQFGLAQTSVVDQILGRVDANANMTAMREQLAEGVIDDDDSFRMNDQEIQDFVRGTLRVRSRWQVKLEPYVSMDQGVLHTTLQGEWSSPYVPLFQAKVTINDGDASDPSKFLATGVLGPDTGVVRLQASFDKATGVLTLVCKDAPGTSITTTFGKDDDSKAFCDMLKNGKIVDVKGRVSALVAQKKLHPKILTSSLSDDDKKTAANGRLLEDLARAKAASLGDEVKQLTEPSSLLDQHYEQLKLQQALDTLKTAGVAPPKGAADKVKNLDQEALIDIAKKLLVNRQTEPPQCGGARAAWLSNIGFLDNDHFNHELHNDNKESYLDDRQREYYSWQLMRFMRNRKHEHHKDVNRWRKLDHQIRMLTHLIQKPPQDKALTDAIEEADDAEPHELQQQAEEELNDRVQDNVEEAELPPEAPPADVESGSDSDSDDDEYRDDYKELDAMLRADPSKVPLLLRERDDTSANDDSMIDAVNPKKALQQQLLVKTETQARRSSSISQKTATLTKKKKKAT